MQTFLPYADFARSAACLDRARLGKQRVEVLQILNVLTGTNEKAGWRNHPAVLQWKGHERSLCEYGRAVCAEWAGRGYKDTCAAKIAAVAAQLEATGASAAPPPWLGDESVHSSHRGRLLQKDGAYYMRHGWTESPDLPYVWPVTKEKT